MATHKNRSGLTPAIFTVAVRRTVENKNNKDIFQSSNIVITRVTGIDLVPRKPPSCFELSHFMLFKFRNIPVVLLWKETGNPFPIKIPFRCIQRRYKQQ